MSGPSDVGRPLLSSEHPLRQEYALGVPWEGPSALRCCGCIKRSCGADPAPYLPKLCVVSVTIALARSPERSSRGGDGGALAPLTPRRPFSSLHLHLP